jgi:hypothetical protein
MTKSVDLLLGSLLCLNALVFIVGVLVRWTFEQWLVPDIVAIVLCGVIGFFKRIRILQLIAAVVIVGMLLRLSTPLWLLIDVFIIGSCLYVGYLFLKGEIHRIQKRVAVKQAP